MRTYRATPEIYMAGTAPLARGVAACPSTTGFGTVVTATATNYGAVPMILGIVVEAATRGAPTQVVSRGMLPRSVTGLPLTAGIATVRGDGRLEIGGSGPAVGRTNNDGTLILQLPAGSVTSSVWDPRTISGCIAWYDAHTTGAVDSFGWPRPLYATLIDGSIADDYSSGNWGKVNVTYAPVTDGAQFNETTANSFHYVGRNPTEYWTNNKAVGAYTTVRAQFELIDGTDRLLWTGDASIPPATPVAFEAWWTNNNVDSRAGANVVQRQLELLSATRRRLTVSYRTTGDTQSIRFGVGTVGTIPSYVGNATKGFRLYFPEINQPKVTAISNRITLATAVQATNHEPQPGYESPVIPGLRGYGFQYLTTTEAALLAAFSGDDPSFTIVLTGKREASGAAQYFLGARDSGGSKFKVGFDSSNKLTVIRDAASLTETSADAAARQVVSLVASGTSYTLRRNGLPVAAGTVDAGSLTMTGLDLLADGAQLNRLNGYLSEALVYNRALSQTELSYLETGLAPRIGL